MGTMRDALLKAGLVDKKKVDEVEAAEKKRQYKELLVETQKKTATQKKNLQQLEEFLLTCGVVSKEELDSIHRAAALLAFSGMLKANEEVNEASGKG